jgi:hypothetical protein
VSDKRSALDALSAAEKAAVLDELLAARPDLRQPAEAYAAQVMTGADRSAVADDVADALQGLGIEELNTRAGYRPGRGYVHPAQAADEILDEALQPFLDDLQRRAGLGTRSAAVELAAGILLGLYSCRHGNSETLLEYCPDYAAERASGWWATARGSASSYPPPDSSTSCPSGTPCCIEPAINPRRPWAREWEAPGPGFLPWHAGAGDWSGAAFCGFWRD